eukprot:2681914-Rhodomonas_salina.1
MVDWLKVPVLTAAVDKMKTAKKPKLDRDYVLRCVLLTLCAHVTHTCPVSDSSWVAGTRRSTSRPLLMPWSSTASAMPTAPRPRAVPASPSCYGNRGTDLRALLYQFKETLKPASSSSLYSYVDTVKSGIAAVSAAAKAGDFDGVNKAAGDIKTAADSFLSTANPPIIFN